MTKLFGGRGGGFREKKKEENEHQYPIEFVNSLCPSGMAPHKLTLKKIACCYGTWTPQMITVMGPDTSFSTYINMSLMPSSHVDHMQGREYSFLESLSYHLKIFLFHMKRKQFPLRPAFPMTSNTAQGQTLQKIGISLQHPFFSHGQLYVVMSSVGSQHAIRIHATKINDQQCCLHRSPAVNLVG